MLPERAAVDLPSIVPAEAERAYDEAGSRSKSIAWLIGRGHNDLSLDRMYWSKIESLAAYLDTLEDDAPPQ